MSVAVVTGASAGLGTAFVRAILRDCPDVDEIWLIARRRERLERLAADYPSARFVVADTDLARSAGYGRLRALLEQRKPKIELLVNDAGLGPRGAFGDVSVEHELAVCDLNVRGSTAVARLCLPYMGAGGRIVQICSIESYIPNQNMAVYGASKAYQLSLGVALRAELRRRSINVLCVCPGRMSDTEFYAKAGISAKTGTSARMPNLDIDAVARRSLELARRGRAVYIPGLVYKGLAALAKVSPLTLVARLAVL